MYRLHYEGFKPIAFLLSAIAIEELESPWVAQTNSSELLSPRILVPGSSGVRIG